jgi:hypothetical protein
MTTPRRITEQGQDEQDQERPMAEPYEESLGDQLMREAREGQPEFVVGWHQFMQELDIQGKPIGAKRLREMLLQTGINPDHNEFSRGIIATREE